MWHSNFSVHKQSFTHTQACPSVDVLSMAAALVGKKGKLLQLRLWPESKKIFTICPFTGK